MLDGKTINSSSQKKQDQFGPLGALLSKFKYFFGRIPPELSFNSRETRTEAISKSYVLTHLVNKERISFPVEGTKKVKNLSSLSEKVQNYSNLSKCLNFRSIKGVHFVNSSMFSISKRVFSSYF